METQLTQREKIPGTPFTLIYQDNVGWFLVMGDHRLTEPTLSKEEQIEKLETNKWELMTTVVISVVERLKQYEETETIKKQKLQKQSEEKDKEIENLITYDKLWNEKKDLESTIEKKDMEIERLKKEKEESFNEGFSCGANAIQHI